VSVRRRGKSLSGWLRYDGKMKEIVDVNTGEIAVSKEGIILRSMAIGSCVVIAGYDWEERVGAIAHIMLPGRAPEKAPEKTKYAADAIDELVNRMAQTGSQQCNIEVCLVGGGNVLKKEDDTICEQNIMSVIQLLQKENIPLRASSLGGTERRTVSLDVEKGKIFCSKAEGKEELLWEAGGRNKK